MTSDLIERLRAGQNGDHERGCEGRTYTCSCGYDDRLQAAAWEAADHIASLEAALAPFAILKGLTPDGGWEDTDVILCYADSAITAIPMSAFRRAARALDGREG